MKTYTSILLQAMLFLVLLTQVNAQNINDDFSYLSFLDKSQFEADILAQGFSEIRLANPNAGDTGLENTRIEADLVYTQENHSNLNSSFWEYEVEYELYAGATLTNSGTLTLSNQELSAVYEDLFGMNTTSEVDYSLKVTSVSVINGTVPDDIRLMLKVRSVPLVAFNISTTPMPSSLAVSPLGDDKKSITWEAIPNALFYELEYDFIDYYETGNPTPFASKSRTVRVQTNTNFYEMNFLFPKGRIYFRVRAAGNNILEVTGENVLEFGAWSATFPAAGYEVDFEHNFNWQSQSVFAEEGKHKQTVGYFDNTLRSRQTVTHLNDVNNILVGESDYDAEGKSVLGIIPVPAPGAANNLRYKEDFNLAASGLPYSYLHFEKEVADNMDASTGAGKYFSTSNESEGIYKDYIPDAEGRPFTHMRYLRDNTGRVEEQGGVGGFFQLDNDHTTRFFYASPSKFELQRLFGGAIGNVSHYKKNIVIDPNGQGSVSYINMNGKPVATALIGEAPSNVQELDDDDFEAISNQTHALVANSGMDPLSSTSVNTIFNSTEGIVNTASFTYDLTGVVDEFQASGGPQCLTCHYILHISVKDPCGEDVIILLESDGEIVNNTLNVTYEQDATGCPDTAPENNVLTFEIGMDQLGSYTIYKTLEVIPYTHTELYNIAVLNVDINHIENELVDNLEEALEDCQIFCEGLDCELEEALNEAYEFECDLKLEIIAQYITRYVAEYDAGSGEAFDLTDYQLNNNFNCAYNNHLSILGSDGNWYDWKEHTDETMQLFLRGDDTPLSSPRVFIDGLGEADLSEQAGFELLFTPAAWQEQWALELAECHCRYLECTTFTPYKVFLAKLYTLRDTETAAATFGLSPGASLMDIFTSTAFALQNPISNPNSDLNSAPFYNDLYGTCDPLLMEAINKQVNNYIAEEHFSDPTERANILELTMGEVSLYAYIDLLWDLISAEDIDEVNENFTENSFKWASFLAIYNEIVERIKGCSSCGPVDDPFPPLPTSGISSLVDAEILYDQILEQANTNNFPNEAGTIIVWEDLYQGIFGGEPSINITEQLDEVYQETCNFGEGACIDFGTPTPTMAFCGDPNIRTITTGGMPFIQSVISAQLAPDFVSPDSIELIGDEHEWWFGFYPANDIEIPIELTHYEVIIHSRFCDIADTEENIKIRIFSSTAASCGTYNPENWDLREDIEINYNAFGNLVCAWNRGNNDTGNVYKSHFIQVYSYDNTDSEIVVEIAEKMQRTTRLLNNNLHRPAISTLYTDLLNETGDKVGALNYISNVWDCENVCVDFDDCFITAMESLKEASTQEGVLDATETMWTSGVPDVACAEGSLTNVKDFVITETTMLADVTGEEIIQSYFTYALGAEGSPDNDLEIRGYLYSEGGYFVPIRDVTIIDYKPTHWSIQTMETAYYELFNFGSSYVKVLCQYKDSDNDDLFIAYIMWFNKGFHVYDDYATDCIPPFDPNDYIVDCEAQVQDIINDQIEDIYQEQIDAEITRLLQESNCLSDVEENFTASYASNEYHYTLYYYDRAGNLLKTIPPAGVHPLTNGFVNGELTNLESMPLHKQATTYQYNSFGQLLQQETPDGGIKTFYYDRVQRLRLSRDDRQLAEGLYAYTKFDAHSRVTEVGEVVGSNINTVDNLNNPDFPVVSTKDVTRTIYDIAAGAGIPQQNLRGRVSCTERYNSDVLDDTPVRTYYSYDVHGNVDVLEQKINGLNAKKTYYNYDLISGNVKMVAYQPDAPDAYFHKYTYDADNRIQKVFTSREGRLWEEDARYFYYEHGPLARAEIGEDKVQGMDYHYTLQGWIKGVNITGTDIQQSEPGKDGNNNDLNNINRYIGRDAYAYTLGYFDADYAPIGIASPGAAFNAWTAFGSEVLAYDQNNHKGILNGNIAWMISDLKGLNDTGNEGLNAMVYQYDQLHRIKQAKSFSRSGNNWNAFTYSSDYTYDPNGNLMSLKRQTPQGELDNLVYDYGESSAPELHPNRLRLVVDSAPNTAAQKDVEGSNDYVYDEIGNLTQDVKAQSTITWDTYGKVKEVNINNAHAAYKTIRYFYDASGNRVIKEKLKQDNSSVFDHYVRDAAGNVMAMYNSYAENNLAVQKKIEAPIYGSSRIAMDKREIDLSDLYDSNTAKRYRSYKYFELSNHLGNVLSSVSDRHLGEGTTTADFYEAEIVSATDYFPFGMEMPGREMSGSKYRFGFNGKEKDENGEWGRGNLTHYDYGARIYNSEIGKWLSRDPLAGDFASESSYVYVSNNPMFFNDPTGMFKTKFGAWLYKKFNGGGSVEYARDKEEYYVGREIQSETAATYKRIFRAGRDNPKNGFIGAVDVLPTALGFAGDKFKETVTEHVNLSVQINFRKKIKRPTLDYTQTLWGFGYSSIYGVTETSIIDSYFSKKILGGLVDTRLYIPKYGLVQQRTLLSIEKAHPILFGITSGVEKVTGLKTTIQLDLGFNLDATNNTSTLRHFGARIKAERDISFKMFGGPTYNIEFVLGLRME